MIKKGFALATAAMFAGATLFAAGMASADVQNTKLKAVGTWANLTNYFDYEKPLNSHWPRGERGPL